MGIFEESIRERRSLLEHRIEQLRRDLLEACAELNTLTHVERLPPEILAEVFLWLQEICVEADDADERIVVSHVCSRWREVAICCKGFWTNIHLPSHSAYIRTAIERSQDATITVLFPSKRSHRKAAAEDMEAILPAMNRVGRLRLSPESASCLASSMRPHFIDTPRLIELYDQSCAASVPMLLSFLNAPNLTSLTLCALHPADRVFQLLGGQTQLVNLHIFAAVELASLLEALRHLPNLCTLTVTFMRCWLSGGVLPRVSLPKLNALNLYGPLSYTNPLLRQLEYPAYIELSMFPDFSQHYPHGTLGDAQPLRDLRETLQHVGKTMARVGEQTNVVGLLEYPDSLQLVLFTSISLNTSPEGVVTDLELCESFNITLTIDEGCLADSLPIVLHAIKDGLLPVIDIQELAITMGDVKVRRWDDENRAKMVGVLRGFEDVEILHVGNLSFRDISSILLPASGSLELPLPALHTLHITSGGGDDSTASPCSLRTDSLHQHPPSCHHHLSSALNQRHIHGADLTRLEFDGAYGLVEEELAELRRYSSDLVLHSSQLDPPIA